MWYGAGEQCDRFQTSTPSARCWLASTSTTVLYWLNDKSAGAADTWAFLSRRIDEVMQVPKMLGKVSAFTSRFPNPFRVAQRVRPRGFRARTAVAERLTQAQREKRKRDSGRAGYDPMLTALSRGAGHGL